MNKRSIKKLVSSLVIACMLFSSFGVAFGATASATSDIKGHWAESQISAWIDKGFIKGYEDGSFKPNNTITRAEFIALINRSFGLTETTAISFSDVASSNWAYAEVAIGVKAGYITGYADGTIGASKPISRQEVAVIVDRLLGLSNTESANTTFTDAGSIAAWAQGAVNAAVAKEILKGYSEDNSFKPSKSITRAEAVVTLDRAVAAKATVYSAAGTYGPAKGTETINGDVVINVAGVVLQNLVINGNLLFAAGIGSGDATLNNVTVKGQTRVEGGGENSIHLNNSIILTIIVDKKNGTVRIVAEGSTTVGEVTVNSPTTIQETGTTGTGFSKVTLSELLPADSKVTLKGSFDSLVIKGDKIQVDIPEGSVKEVIAESTATGMTLNLGADAKIVSLILDAVVKMLGTGTIETATLSAVAKKDTTFEKQPDKKVDKVEGTVTPTTTPAPTATTPTPTSSSGDTSSPTVVSKTALGTAITAAESVYSSAHVGIAIGEYTQAVVDTVYGVITSSKVVFNNSSATQATVDTATTTLNAAVVSFLAAAIQADKAALTSAITSAQTVSSAAVIGTAVGNYSQANKDILDAAITSALSIKNNMLSTQTAVDTAVTSVNNAKTAFQATAVSQTGAGTIAVSSTNVNTASTNESINITYSVYGNYANGTVTFTLPVGITASVSNATYTVNGGSITAVTNIAGQVVTINGITANDTEQVELIIDNQTIPAAGTYSFSATGDLDGTGASNIVSAGTGTETSTIRFFGITGSVAILAASYNVGDLISVTVTDADLNTDIAAADTVTVNVYSTFDTTGIMVTLTETGLSTGVFTGTATVKAASDDLSDFIGAVTLDTITARYNDVLDSNGATPAAVTASATVN
jgi:hypothetical protein